MSVQPNSTRVLLRRNFLPVNDFPGEQEPWGRLPGRRPSKA